MNVAWANTRSPVDFAAGWAAYLPERPAIRFEGETVSYGELDRRASATAAWLVGGEMGLPRGARVALLAHNHGFFFELAFACFRAGLVLAPLNYRLSASELVALVALSEPALLFADQANLAVAERLGDGAGLPVRSIERHLAERPEGGASTATLVGTGLEETALLLFTSGTTGQPKAAALPARQIFWNAVNTQLAFDLSRDDATVLYTPLFHTGAINVLAMPLLQRGGLVHVHAGFDAEAVTRSVAEGGVSVLFGVPTTLQSLAATEGFLEAAARGVKLVLCGGAPLPVSLIRQYEAQGVALTQGFGMTEVGPNCFFLPPDQVSQRAGSVGKPIFHMEARVVPVDGGGREAEEDEVGELWLRGPVVGLGYFRNEAASEASFSGDWFRTGDLVRRDGEGFFYVAGRHKEMFISGGENVYPAEVEVALHGHPQVRECAVVPAPDPRWGEVGVAFVVPRGEACEAGALRAFLRERLAHYKVPKAFVLRDELPRNESGKVRKSELAEEARRHA